MKSTVGSWIALVLALVAPGVMPAVAGEAPPAVQAVQVTRQGMADTVGYLSAQEDVFPPSGQKARFPDLNRRLALWRAWQGFLDRVLVLDQLSDVLFSRYAEAQGEARAPAFRLAYAAFLAQYRQSLDFIAVVERNPDMHILLNETVPELGLPERSYARLKFRFLNVLRGAEFARLEVLYSSFGADPDLDLTPGLEADRLALWRAGQGAGPQLTVENGVQIMQDTAHAGWFPVQKQVAEWMGDTKVWRPHVSLVQSEQLAALQPRLEPGDVLLVRREWYLSNVGLPGFWPHAALYVGTPDERSNYFADASVRQWVRESGEASGDLEALLRSHAPQAARDGASALEAGHPPRVIEAISEGVSLTSLEHAAGGDSLVVIRPRLAKVARARAILRAFHYTGRPYDFDFDFRTDATLVCTELVAKAYEGDDRLPGLEFPTVELLGRKVTPANEIARQFDADFGTVGQQFDLVAFLDGQEALGRALPAGVEDFRRSWRRPKWHVLVQEAPPSKN